MPESSRTAKSVKNARVALIFYFTNLVPQFFSRKVFLDYLGAGVFGLNTTAQNLLGLLNSAGLGTGSATFYVPYRPLLNKGSQTINEIVSVQGWPYRKVAIVVVVAACVLMCFLPLIFGKAKVPLWYIYASFSALLFSALLGYIFSYKQIVLTADQKKYKITLNIQGVKVVKVVAQVLATTYLTNGYVYWLILEFLMGTATMVVIEYVLHREYPWLHPQPQLGGLLHKKHEEITRKTKQTSFHRAGGFTFTQSSSIIIYAYAFLSLVVVYGNYMLVVIGLQMLVSTIFNSINAGIGNLMAKNDKERTVSVFNELFSLHFYTVAVVCYGYYMLAGSFISPWIGEEYILDHTTLLLITTTLFAGSVRNIIDSFNDAYGLFQNVWTTVVETCINIGCSAWLGYLWGLPGILVGVLLSLLLIIFLWEPYFLFGWGFRIPVPHYWKLYFGCFMTGAVAVVIRMIMFFIMAVNSEGDYRLSYPDVVVVILSVISSLTLCSTSSSMWQGIGRILNLIRKCW